jgi:tetrahydromethanopterin S-methyltransferase subunit A
MTNQKDLDKVIKNVITNPTLRYLIVAGPESKGHATEQTLLALAQNGVDENGRVIGSLGKRPVLRNVTAPGVQAFREQMQVVDMLGCENPDDTSARIEALARQAQPAASLNRAVRLSWWIARWRRAP